MRSLFRAFETRRVAYLVISGQASVLYGGAFFSQDLDLWVEPTSANARRLLEALARLRARVHKLTPPLSLRNLRRGHGFHFLVPQRGAPDLYLDVMGRPPRVGGFAAALRRAQRMVTPWGTLPVVSLEDLVELKKTNRPSDYEVISRLVLIRLSREPRPGPRLLAWALRNVFRPEDLWAIVQRHGRALGAMRLPPAARLLYQVLTRGREPTAGELSLASRHLAAGALRLQEQGRAYWTPLLAELRELRAAELLLPEGSTVASLLTEHARFRRPPG